MFVPHSNFRYLVEKQLLVTRDVSIVAKEIPDFKKAGLSVRWSSQVPQRGEFHPTVVDRRRESYVQFNMDTVQLTSPSEAGMAEEKDVKAQEQVSQDILVVF